MKETKIMKVFDNYLKKFDMMKGNIKSMYFHSIKMMELCKEIASNIGVFNEEEILVCGLIGLLHDIGMFNEKSKKCLFIDEEEDYSKESINIIFSENGLLRQITQNKDYDDFIKIAIYCHNKQGLPNGFDAKTLYYCMVLKDAHILETFRLITNYPYMDMYIDYFPNDRVYNEFKQYKPIPTAKSGNDADKILEVLSLVFGVNCSYTYNIINSEDSVNKLIKALIIENKGISKFFIQIATVMNVYIKRKIGA